MIFLGIDYGSAKIGLAKASSETGIATPFCILKNDLTFETALHDIINDEAVDEIIVGHPLNLSGKPSDQTREVEAFADRIRLQFGKTVHLQDERFSTKSAVAGKQGDDSSAAALMLQTFLDAQ